MKTPTPAASALYRVCNPKRRDTCSEAWGAQQKLEQLRRAAP